MLHLPTFESWQNSAGWDIIRKEISCSDCETQGDFTTTKTSNQVNFLQFNCLTITVPLSSTVEEDEDAKEEVLKILISLK
jgi:hypothetical protein